MSLHIIYMIIRKLRKKIKKYLLNQFGIYIWKHIQISDYEQTIHSCEIMFSISRELIETYKGNITGKIT